MYSIFMSICTDKIQKTGSKKSAIQNIFVKDKYFYGFFFGEISEAGKPSRWSL